MLELTAATVRILILLWGINLAPPLAAFVLGERLNAPLDRGRRLRDGRPVLGRNKTWRGLVAALLTGPLLSLLLLFPAWVGLACAALSMIGDLATSFAKRRLEKPEGWDLPFADHLPEGALPLLFLSIQLQLDALHGAALLLLFLLGGRYGASLYQRLLFEQPGPRRLRSGSPRLRIKELASCQSKPSRLAALVHFDEAVYYHLVLATSLRLCGLYERGRQNALAFGLSRYEASLPDLPSAFEGYRILFLSDLHVDGLTGLTERLLGLMRKIDADLCILGGDYRMSKHGSWQAGIPQMKRLLETLDTPDGVLAVLGNHDCLEMVEELQQAGVRFLLNESAALQRGGERLCIVGVDDPHYYRCHDLEQAFSEVSLTDICLFVAHSPVLFDAAAERGARIYLAGHTHAGQIQLPGLGMVYTHCPAPRRVCSGPWEHKGMLGYTSAGVGVSGVPVRYNCRGEVLLLRLAKGPANLQPIQ